MDLKSGKRWSLALAALAIAGCATVPSEPSVLALPGSGRSFDEFRADDFYCRDYAFDQSGAGARQQAANTTAVQNAAIGTAIGALAGAAIGGRHGSGVGAGMGLMVGSASGADASRRAMHGSQRHYENAYIQCMYARGHRVPVGASYTSDKAPHSGQALPPPPSGSPSIPPPPPGNPPPPPPR